MTPVTDDRATGTASTAASLDALEARLGVTFRDRAVLLAAMTHPSYTNEHPEDDSPTNERLEFLGDAALGLIVAETLYARFPDVQEGRLTEWRSALVCGPMLSHVATEQLGLGEWLRLGRGEEQTGGREREGNLERAYEATVGAIYLDIGLEAARAFVARTLGPEVDALARDPGVLNPKGTLQQLAQDVFGRPDYVLVAQDGPEHDRQFSVEVRFRGERFGIGHAGSKQEAEKEAARQALPAIRARLAAGDGGPAKAGADGAAGQAAPGDEA